MSEMIPIDPWQHYMTTHLDPHEAPSRWALLSPETRASIGGVAIAMVRERRAGRDTAQVPSFSGRFEERVRALPGVEAEMMKVGVSPLMLRDVLEKVDLLVRRDDAAVWAPILCTVVCPTCQVDLDVEARCPQCGKAA